MEVTKRLNEIATRDLVDELSRRQGVVRHDVDPYQQCKIESTGPVIILEVVD